MLHCFRPTTLALALLLGAGAAQAADAPADAAPLANGSSARCPSTSCVPSPRFSTG